MSEERIRDYIIEGMIGAGGMGVVYLARHTTLDRKAAIKVLLESFSINQGIRERFIQEAKLMAALDHPSIVRLFDFVSEPKLSLIMEYIDGRGLDRMIGQEVGPIPFEKALPLFSQVLSGVGYAHSRGVVHRDIKPANILVSKEGEVKITDFGIAKIAGQKGMTRTGAQMGTLYYESPEQIKGARDVDHRADIYALGMTLYEMLAGRLPFDENGDTSEYAIMDSIVKREEHLDPRVYYPHIPEWLVGVVQKSTELDADKRYQDCDSFQRAIQEHGGNLNTGEHAYWSGRVASVNSSVISASEPVSSSTPAPVSPEEACSKCGSRVKDAMEFCGECGQNLMQTCPSCKTSMRWHLKFCLKCGVNIAEKHSEIEAEKERKRKAEEKRMAEQKAEEERKRLEKERSSRERAEAVALRKAEAEARRLRRKQWRKRHGWKVALAALFVFSSLGYLIYRESDSYAYRQAEKLYESGDHAAAVSAFAELGNYRDSHDRSFAIRYEQAEALYSSSDYAAAVSAFAELGNYRDSHSRVLESRFQVEGDVIFDHLTNLEWRVGQDSNTNWDAANTWAEGLGDGWRMPTRTELRGLWDAGISSDNWGPFENSGYWVWSSEVRDSSSAWYFGFRYGTEAWRNRSTSYNGRGFAVRLRG